MRVLGLAGVLFATSALPCSYASYCYGLLEPNGMVDVPTNVVPLVECSGNPDINANENISNTVKLQRALYDGGIDDAGFIDVTYERPSPLDHPFRVGVRPIAELAPDSGYELVLLGWPRPRVAGRFHTGAGRDDGPPLPPMFFGATTTDAPDASFTVACGETVLRHLTLSFADAGERVRQTLFHFDGGIFIQNEPQQPTGWLHCSGASPDRGWTLRPGQHSFRAVSFDLARNASTETVISFTATCPPPSVSDGGGADGGVDEDGGALLPDGGPASSDAGARPSPPPESEGCGCGHASGAAMMLSVALTALATVMQRRQRKRRPA